MQKNILQTVLLTLSLITSSWLYAQDSNCLDFNGNDYVLIGDVNDLGTSDFTIEAWIYVESNFDSNKIISKGTTTAGTPSNAGYSLRASFEQLGADNIIDFGVAESNQLKIRLEYQGVKLNEWCHVAGVRDGQMLYLYINGSLVNSADAGMVYNTDTNIPLVIGAIDKANGTVDEFMDGKIDEVRIWNIARTQQQIDEDKDCAITSPTEGLLAVYNLDSTTGNIAIDNSGNGNDGMLQDSPTWVSSDVATNCVTSIDENFADEIIIHPNPFDSHVIINGLEGENEIKLFDVKGKEIMNIMTNENKLELGHLEIGVYILNIYTKNNLLIKKIVKR